MPATPDADDESLTPRQRAARANGRRSRGPTTPEGKARSAKNALKHGLRSEHAVVLESEDAGAYVALGAALELDLAPLGAMERALVERIASALWRLRRAERLETLHFERALADADDPGADPLASLDGPRLATLLRYQAHLRSELYRAHAALRRAQRERRAAAARELPERTQPPRGRDLDAFGRPLPPEPRARARAPGRDTGRVAAALRRDPALAEFRRAEVAGALADLFRPRVPPGGAPLPSAAPAATSGPCRPTSSSTSP
jgi:hypothetical protein